MSEESCSDNMACLFVCVPVFLSLLLSVHACAYWGQTFPSASQTVRDVCQMVMLVLSQQIDLFSSDINEHVLLWSFPPPPRVNSHFFLSPSQLMQLNLSPSIFLSKSLSVALGPFCSPAQLQKSLCYLQPEHRRLIWAMSPLHFFSGVCLLNNWSKWRVFLSVNYVPQCEHSSNSQLWKLYFRWVYVVIISFSHVTGCMCVFVWVCFSLYVRTCLWAGVCLCLHDSRPEREVTQEAAEGRELQTLHCCRGREREREREKERKRGRGRKTTDR